MNPNANTTASRIGIPQGLIPLLSLVLRWRRTRKGSLVKCSNFFMLWVFLLKKKAEKAAYQLKDIAQVLYEPWKDERPVIEGRITLRTFKFTFIDRFFSLDLKESKMQ